MNRSSIIEPLEGRRLFSAAAGVEIHPVLSITTVHNDVHAAARVAQTSAGPTVLGVQVNDGDPQRSMVNSLTVTFDQPVALDAGAITLTGRGGAGAGTGLVGSNPSGDKQKFVLTFSGSPVVGGSLADGIYDLSVFAAKVHAGTPAGPAMEGNFTFTFHRLFGDAQGNKHTNAADFNAFRPAFGKTSGQAGYKWYFDYDASGVINGADYNHFRPRFGNSFIY